MTTFPRDNNTNLPDMKKSKSSGSLFALSMVSILLLSTPSQSHAFGGPPGGPFSNGSYFPNDGTFSAVVRGTNLTGTLQFSTTEGAGPAAPTDSTTTSAEGFGVTVSQTTSTEGSGGVGSTGIANIYYNGRTYTGNSQGSYNAESSGMSVFLQANSAGQGEQSRTLSTIVDLGDQVETTTTISSTGTVVVVESITPQRSVEPSREISYFDTFYLNGFANCKTSNAFPNQKFKGNGEIVAQELDFNQGNSDPQVVTAPPLKISIQGVRLSDTASFFNTERVRPPSITSVTTLIP